MTTQLQRLVLLVAGTILVAAFVLASMPATAVASISVDAELTLQSTSIAEECGSVLAPMPTRKMHYGDDECKALLSSWRAVVVTLVVAALVAAAATPFLKVEPAAKSSSTSAE